jgi:hypothetical protein
MASISNVVRRGTTFRDIYTRRWSVMCAARAATLNWWCGERLPRMAATWLAPVNSGRCIRRRARRSFRNGVIGSSSQASTTETRVGMEYHHSMAAPSRPCLRCGSDEYLVPNLPVERAGEGADEVTLLFVTNPHAAIFRGHVRFTTFGTACCACGHVEITINQRADLWAAYCQREVLPLTTPQRSNAPRSDRPRSEDPILPAPSPSGE